VHFGAFSASKAKGMLVEGSKRRQQGRGSSPNSCTAEPAGFSFTLASDGEIAKGRGGEWRRQVEQVGARRGEKCEMDHFCSRGWVPC
jgi:hypothetical protein